MHDNSVAHLEIKNSLFYDSPEHKAIYSAGDLILNNVTIEDVFSPRSNGRLVRACTEWSLYCPITPTLGLYKRMVKLQHDQLNIENSAVMTYHKTGYKMEFCQTTNGSSNYGCTYGGPDFYCHTIYTSGALTLSNSNISGNCLAQFEYHGLRIFDWAPKLLPIPSR